MYEWRKMTPAQREAELARRRTLEVPLHSPPHQWNDSPDAPPQQYLITGTCYEHAHFIGTTCDRTSVFAADLLQVARPCCLELYAWCVLTNHYHLLVCTDRLRHLTRTLGRLHGRISRTWNLEDNTPGRQVWHRCSDRRMRSEAHFWTTMNYVHHNPVRHGHVVRWLEWPWSSAREYLEQTGHEEAIRIWRNYPLRDYGRKWDR